MVGMKKTLLVVLVIILVGLPLLSLANGLVPCGGQPPCCEKERREDPLITGCSNDFSVCKPRCQLCHLFVLFKNVIDFFLTKIVPSLAVLVIAVGGFMYLFAYINPEGTLGGTGGPALISKANSLFRSVVFGLIIIFAAWIIINVFFQVIGVADWTGLKEGWWKIDCPIK